MPEATNIIFAGEISIDFYFLTLTSMKNLAVEQISNKNMSKSIQNHLYCTNIFTHKSIRNLSLNDEVHSDGSNE